MMTEFNMKYPIRKKYLTVRTGKVGRRPGYKMNVIRFLVAHDTGNDGSTALGNISYYERTHNDVSASAHTFIDHTGIYECIPLTTGVPEKAWHVIYQKPKDNELYGVDANDASGGVELCYSYKKGSINNEESYKKYVWYLAYCCYKFKLNPAKDITGHHILDPQRKTDPKNALGTMGKSYAQLLQDVVKEYYDCLPKEGIILKLKQWQIDMGKQAIDNLHRKTDLNGQKIVSDTEEWKKKLETNPEVILHDLVWLTWVLFDRVTNK